MIHPNGIRAARPLRLAAFDTKNRQAGRRLNRARYSVRSAWHAFRTKPGLDLRTHRQGPNLGRVVRCLCSHMRTSSFPPGWPPASEVSHAAAPFNRLRLARQTELNNPISPTNSAMRSLFGRSVSDAARDQSERGPSGSGAFSPSCEWVDRGGTPAPGQACFSGKTSFSSAIGELRLQTTESSARSEPEERRHRELVIGGPPPAGRSRTRGNRCWGASGGKDGKIC